MLTGQQWLDRLGDRVVPLARQIAVARYGEGLTDLDDRVGDALLGLVKAAERYNPVPKQDSLGYFLDFALRTAAGEMRHGGSQDKAFADTTDVFTDLDPEELGIEELWMPTSEVWATEAVWHVRGDKFFTTPELVDAIASSPERAKIATRKLGLEAGDPQLRIELLHELERIENTEQIQPAWVGVAGPTREPIAKGLQGIPVTRRFNGEIIDQMVIPGDVVTEMVNQASLGAAPADHELLHFEERVDEAEKRRPVPAMAEDQNQVSPEVPAFVHKQVHKAFAAWAAEDGHSAIGGIRPLDLTVDQEAWVRKQFHGRLPSTYRGWRWVWKRTKAPINQADRDVMWVLYQLGQLLADEEDAAVTIVLDDLTQWLAGLLTDMVSEIGWFLRRATQAYGNGYGWDHEPESGIALQARAERFVEGLQGYTKKERGDPSKIWPSQVAAISAVLLHGASPAEAKRVAQAAFAA